MSKETAVAIDEILGREAFDRETIEELRRRAETALKERQAIEQFAASLAGESAAAARQKRGVALAVLGRHAEAVPALEAAGAASPARLLLGRCYGELGRFEEALSVLRGLNPDGWTQFDIDMAIAGTVVAAGQADEAIAVLKKHATDGEDQPEYHFQLGCALEAAGETETAAEAYQAALDRGAHTGAAFRLGRLADRCGDDDLARTCYEQCLRGASTPRTSGPGCSSGTPRPARRCTSTRN